AVPNLTATNTLYVANFRESATRQEMARVGLSMLSSEVFDQWVALGRKYPDGLLKLEPSDLSSLLVPKPVAKKSGAIRAYRYAVKLLLSGRSQDARALADNWVEGIRPKITTQSSTTKIKRIA